MGGAHLRNASPAHRPPAYLPLTTSLLTAVDFGCCPTPPYSPSGNQQMTEPMPGAAGYNCYLTRSTLPHPVHTETEKHSPQGTLPNYRLFHSRTPSPVYPSTVLEMTRPFSADRHPLQPGPGHLHPFSHQLRPALTHYLRRAEQAVDGQCNAPSTGTYCGICMYVCVLCLLHVY